MGGEQDDVTRRQALTVIAGGAVLATGCAATVDSHIIRAPAVQSEPSTLLGVPNMPFIPALLGNHSVVPLPFAAGALTGLSERLITSHHENNYGGAVRNLNRVELELAQLTTDTPPFVVTGLRERELTFRNSKTLHEAYFANLGGNGKRSGAIESALAQTYGTTARWEQHMQATGMGLGGGSGWAILAFELETGALRTVSLGNHTQALVSSIPLLVMDLYEHSYQMDFGAAVARYIDSFFANIHWDEVNRRLEGALKARAALLGSA